MLVVRLLLVLAALPQGRGALIHPMQAMQGLGKGRAAHCVEQLLFDLVSLAEPRANPHLAPLKRSKKQMDL